MIQRYWQLGVSTFWTCTLLLGCVEGEIDVPTDDIPSRDAPILNQTPTDPDGNALPEIADEDRETPRGDGGQCEQSHAVGSCDGHRVTRCIAGYLETINCQDHGRTCGLVSEESGMGCIFETPQGQPPNDLPPDSEPEGDSCQGITAVGQCDGDVIARCVGNNQLETEDCSTGDLICGWNTVASRWGCIQAEQPEPPAPPEPPAQPAPPVEPEQPEMDVGCGSDIERQIVVMANESRGQNGAGQLACDGALTLAARLHSEDMCAQDYFSHTGQDGSSAGDRMRRAGAQFRSWAENIAYGYRSAQQVHTGWMNSAGHRRNLLNGSLGRIGVGHADCNGRPYWTQVFAD